MTGPSRRVEDDLAATYAMAEEPIPTVQAEWLDEIRSAR
jgi:hypothetical protein